MDTFYQLGKKYAFSPLLSFPFNNFFPQHVIWPYFFSSFFLGGGGHSIQWRGSRIRTPVLKISRRLLL